MLKRAGFALTVSLLIGGIAFGGTYRSIAELNSYKADGSSVDFVCVSDEGKEVFVKIDVCTPEVIRVRCARSKIAARVEHVVVKQEWSAVETNVSENPESVVIDTGRLKLIAAKKPFRLSIYDKRGRLVLQESPAGMRWTKNEVFAFMKLGADEHFFGFGAAAGIGGRMGFEGQFFNRLDKRGQKINIVGRRVGFFMSTGGYGIFLNGAYPYNSIFRMGCDRPDVFSFECTDSQLDYYFIYGPSFKDMLGRYTELTGRTPLIPKWGFGARQAGYWDQKQIETYSAQYREKDIPCDVIHLDSNWLNKGSEYKGKGVKPYGKNNRGYVDFKWDDRQFPNPDAMISKLKKAGFKFTIWETALVNPNVGEFYEDAVKNGYFVKNEDGSICMVRYGKRGMTAIPDFTNPATVKWWKAEHKPLMDMGVKSFKLDHTGDLGTAKKAIFHNGWNLQQMRILHRILNLRTVFEASEEHSGQRGMIWSSIATAGTQRYPVTWCGDYKLTFEALQEVVKSTQNMGLSGFGYFAPDIPGKRNIKDGHLYLRWAQFGLMNPVCQSWTVVPWQFGAEVEESYRYYAKLHYRLLPYIYSYAHVANKTGVPICRAMVLEFQGDKEAYEQDLQYFFGSELLVAPICTEQNSREIYLPAGKWIDYSTGERFNGPTKINYEAPLGRMPIFVRGGAIIPMGPEMNYVGEKPMDSITLDIYPSGTSRFTLYEDDGASYEYRRGVFALTSFVCAEVEDGLAIDIGPGRGGYTQSGGKSYVLKLNGVSGATEITAGAERVPPVKSKDEFDGSKMSWWYDSSSRTLWVKAGAVSTGDGKKVHIYGSKVLN